MVEDVVIHNGNYSGHNIEVYKFKEIALDDDITHIFEPSVPQNANNNSYTAPSVHHSETPIIPSEMVEKLEQLFNSLNTMESKFVNQSHTIVNYFETDKVRSYEDGIRQGEAQARAKLEAEIDEIKQRLLTSIDTLNQEELKFQTLSQKLETELVDVAIDIAKQVVENEVSKDSTKVAYSLARKLMQDLDTATEITIKVNPVDYVYLKESLATSNKIKIDSDRAIAKGGVVLISDVGGIDGSIKERFVKIANLTKE